MKIERVAALPLITHDPFFSIWCNADALNAADPVHWSGARQKLRGFLEIDGVPYCFMGAAPHCQPLPQVGVEVTATSTRFLFENRQVALAVTFTSPLLLEEPALAARPCSYIDLQLLTKAPAVCRARLECGADLVRSTPGKVIGCSGRRSDRSGDRCGSFAYAQMGRAAQRPLGGSGDRVTIDWGRLYLASADRGAQLSFEPGEETLNATVPFDVAGGTAHWVIAYDDLAAIHYFGSFCPGYWTHRWPGILPAIADAIAGREALLSRCAALDSRLEDAARQLGGEDYALLCTLSYRHTVAAHKLIADGDGQLVMLSKENDSNGCIGTVDVTYPSAPLFLLADPEYLRALLRPVFRFAACDVWGYDFAPHDVGRYPYADGQVYGLRAQTGAFDGADGSVYPPFYEYPAGSDIYDDRYQMPVEECGNMLVLTAAACLAGNDASFAAAHLDTLRRWAAYLLRCGADPGEQLCTDDFAGHLAHNVNLSAKAVMGLEGLAQILRLLGDMDGYADYHAKAAAMAGSWQQRAFALDHYALAYGQPEGWSLKYNLVWDLLFDSHLFSPEVYQTELAWYVQHGNAYGVPLDSRAAYTKSDWILWCAAMARDDATRRALIAPVAAYLRQTPTRVPFSDWYDTVTGRFVHFIARSVQGGIFMPLLVQRGL